MLKNLLKLNSLVFSLKFHLLLLENILFVLERLVRARSLETQLITNGQRQF